jgi:hypothetical protein
MKKHLLSCDYPERSCTCNKSIRYEEWLADTKKCCEKASQEIEALLKGMALVCSNR